jgi:hypothetical protein
MSVKPLSADAEKLCEELYEVAYHCRVEDVKRLLEAGTDADVKCGYARTTPLQRSWQRS